MPSRSWQFRIDDIIEGINNIVINYARFLEEIKQLRDESQKEWSDKLVQLNSMMGFETQ